MSALASRLMKPTRLALAAAPLAALALTVPASAATHARVLDIGHCTASGTDASCTTGGGQIKRPATIWVNVHASPDQKVDVYWAMSCDGKHFSVSSDDGNFTARSPVRSRRLRLPGRRPSECWVTATVDLHGFGARGKINGWLTATKR